MGVQGVDDAQNLVWLTLQLRGEAERVTRLAASGAVSVTDAREAMWCALVSMRARLEPALDPCINAEPVLRP